MEMRPTGGHISYILFFLKHVERCKVRVAVSQEFFYILTNTKKRRSSTEYVTERDTNAKIVCIE